MTLFRNGLLVDVAPPVTAAAPAPAGPPAADAAVGIRFTGACSASMAWSRPCGTIPVADKRA